MACLAAAAACAAGAPNAPERLVSFSPALTEILFAIGAGSRVTGVADFCEYPAGAKARCRVGGIANPNLELLLTLNPDLVLLQGDMDVLRRFCSQHRLPIQSFELDSWVTITNGIVSIGDLTGCGDRARAVVADMARRWEAVRRAGSAHPPVPAFLCLGRDIGSVASCMTASRGSFIAEALAVAGGSNVCGDVKGFYPAVAAEVLTARKPAVIFELRPGEAVDAAQHARLMREWEPLKAIPAVNHKAVLVLTNDHLLIAGPRLVETAELFARLLAEMKEGK